VTKKNKFGGFRIFYWAVLNKTPDTNRDETGKTNQAGRIGKDESGKSNRAGRIGQGRIGM
jgi:hypothetical protein